MRQLTHGIAGVVFAVMVLCPQVASAGIIDFIWELSGPEFAGAPINCFVELRAPSGDSPDYECRISEKHIAGDKLFRYRRPTPRLRFEIGGGVYISTGKDSDLREFEFGKAQLFAYEPQLHFRSYESGSTTITHGVMGLSYFFITGSDFKRFDNVGFKFAPAQVRYKKLIVTYTFRVFPNAFTAEQFGAPATTTTPTGAEVVHGVMIGWLH